MNTFIITSTIDCCLGVLNTNERYNQTKQTIKSVRNKVPDSRIIFIDNSINPIKIDLDVDHVVNFKHNMFTKWVNQVGSKGLGEAYMLSKSLDFIKQNNLKSKRIFKLSGRYRLAEGFDIKTYNNNKFKGMYAFCVNDWDVSTKSNQWYGNITVRYLETRLYSFCETLSNEYQTLVDKMFASMLENYGQLMCNWEMNHCQFIPEDKLIKMNPIYVEGLNAENGVYRFE